MDCDACTLNTEQRRSFSCGWLPESERSGKGEVPAGYLGERPDICPGYLIQLPQVHEAARANSWRETGALREFYDGRPIAELAKTAIDIIATENRKVSNFNIRNPTPPKG